MKKAERSLLTQIIMQMETSIECLDAVHKLLFDFLKEGREESVKNTNNTDKGGN